MQSASRRAFFTGRRPTGSPWETFCARMRRTVQGAFIDSGQTDGVGRARLVASDPADVHHARALCAEYGVVLALDGVPAATEALTQSLLRVQPGVDMSTVREVPDAPGKWFVQPGALVAEVQQAGLRQFDSMPLELTVAACLADRRLMNVPTGQVWRTGLALAGVLLADGTTATLGPFGTQGRQPLATLTLQQLVPALFRLSSGASAQTCRQQTLWPSRYRLDALLPDEGHDVNLAHLLPGHGGDLAWIEWMVFETVDAALEPATWSGDTEAAEMAGASAYAAQDLDAHTKVSFDPCGIFPHPGQVL